MAVDVIEAIEKLWKVLLILALFLTLLMFRAPITGFLNRSTRVRVTRGKTAVEFTQEDEDLEAGSAEAEPPPSNVPPDDETEAEAASGAEPDSPTNWRLEMYKAIVQGRLEAADEAFLKLQEQEADKLEKLRLEAGYLSLRYRFGRDSDALRRLKELAREEGVKPEAQYQLGLCYEKAGEDEAAAAAYLAAYRIEDRPMDKAFALSLGARSLWRAGQREAAFESLREGLAETEGPSERQRLFEEMAHLYKLQGNSELEAMAYEKAIEADPSRSDLHFNAGYAYTQAGRHHLAMIHYQALLSMEPDHGMGNNNLGVVFDRLGIKFKSRERYQEAAAAGESLAMANLAYQFMGAGFGREADEVIQEARKQDNVHQNVGGALTRLQELHDEYKNLEEQALSSANEEQRLRRQYAEALFGRDAHMKEGAEFKGDQAGATLDVNGRLEGSWAEDDQEFDFKANLSPMAGVVRFSSRPIYSEEAFSEAGEGFAFLSEDAEKLIVVHVHDAHVESLELTRAPSQAHQDDDTHASS